MKLKTFIDRPILSCAISVLILILGVIGLSNLPMEQYPDIAPPTIMVSTTYTGANAETVLKSAIAPLEEAINGVENMTYMTSTASNAGVVDITEFFPRLAEVLRFLRSQVLCSGIREPHSGTHRIPRYSGTRLPQHTPSGTSSVQTENEY